MTKIEFEELQNKFLISGKTLKAFLKEEGIAYSTYNYWSKKVRDEAVALPIVPIKLHQHRELYTSGDVSISGEALPGVTLAFPNGVRAHFGRGSEVMLMDVLSKSMGYVLPQ